MSETLSTLCVPCVGDGIGGVDLFLSSGVLVGETLILTMSDQSTVNIPLTGLGGSIDFNNLTAAQKSALLQCVRGDLVCDAFSNDMGFLVPL